MNNELRKIVDQIDSAIAPARMSKAKARDFLDELASGVQAKIDALAEDMGEDE